MHEKLRRKVAAMIGEWNDVKKELTKRKLLGWKRKKKSKFLDLQTQMCLQISIRYGESNDLVATLQAQNLISGFNWSDRELLKINKVII